MSKQTKGNGMKSWLSRFLSTTNMALTLILLSACAASLQTTGTSTIDNTLAEHHGLKSLEELSYDELIKKGNVYLTSNNFKMAKLYFLNALQKKRQSAPAYFGMGEIMRHEDKIQNALNSFAVALQIDGHYVPALMEMGKIFRELKNYAMAEKYLEKALTLQGDDPVILTELAILHDSMGKELSAEPLYKKVVALLPGDASAHNNLGFNYLLQKKYQKAISEFQQALSIQPNIKRIQNNLAAVYAITGDEKSAYRLMAKNISQAAAYNNLGYIYVTQGKCEKAKNALQLALDLNPRFYVRAHENQEQLKNCIPNALPEDQVTVSPTNAALTGKPASYTISGKSENKRAADKQGKDVFPNVVKINRRKGSGTSSGNKTEISEASEFTESDFQQQLPKKTESASIQAEKFSRKRTIVKNSRFKKPRIVGVYVGNLRFNPSLESEVIGYLIKGERVLELMRKNDWCFVKLADGRLGWAHKTLFWENADDSQPEHVLRGNPEILSATKKQALPDSLSADNKMISGAAAENRLESNHRQQAIEATPGPESPKQSGESTAKSKAMKSTDMKMVSTKKSKIEDVNKAERPGQLNKKGDSKEASHWVQKSFELVSQGKYAESITAADMAISLDPGLANPYINRAWAYSETGQYDKAIGDCDIALAIMPDNALAYNNRGLAHHRKGELSYARRDYKKACELNLEVGCKNYEIVTGRI